MAKFLGHDLSKMSKDEINALMAEWRARRTHGKNGRLGYRMPEGQKIKTDNFPDPTKTWKPGMMAKEANEHIKCVFVCSRKLYSKKCAYRQTNIYYIGFLTDSNRYGFDEFRDSPSHLSKDKSKHLKQRLRRYIAMFGKKNIDKDTEITICSDGMNEGDEFMPIILNFMRSFTESNMSRTSLQKILKKYLMEFSPFGSSSRTMYKNCDKYRKRKTEVYLIKTYDYIADNSLCPWITSEHRDEVKSMKLQMRHSRIFVELGLLYCLMVKFAYMKKKAAKTE